MIFELLLVVTPLDGSPGLTSTKSFRTLEACQAEGDRLEQQVRSSLGAHVKIEKSCTQKDGATTAESPVVLWRNLTLGMSKDQVRSLYPDGKFDLTPECRVSITPRYRESKLFAVNLSGIFGRCSDIIFQSMVEKYDHPADVKTRETGLVPSTTYYWRNGDVIMLMSKMGTAGPSTLVYMYRPPSPEPASAAPNL